MSYSAKDLFQDWYTYAIKGENLSIEISQRREALNSLLKTNNIEFWIDSIRIYYGLATKDSESYEFYVKECKKFDENFPVQTANNKRVVRVMAGCLLAQKIEQEGRSTLADILCLTIIVANYLDRSKDLPIKELEKFALRTFMQECVNVRDIGKIDAGDQNKKSSIEPLELEQLEGDDSDFVSVDSYNESLNSIQSGLNTVGEEVSELYDKQKSLVDGFEKLNYKVDVLQEELNILWWIYGEYSKNIDEKFENISLPFAIVVASKELANLTLIDPGLISVKNYLSKILSGTLKSNAEKFMFGKIIESASANKHFLDLILDEVNLKYEDVTPCLQALHMYKEHEYENSWFNLFKKRSQLPLEKGVDLLNFGSQLYYEMMLMKLLNSK